jgi:hypothetical protein
MQNYMFVNLAKKKTEAGKSNDYCISEVFALLGRYAALIGN